MTWHDEFNGPDGSVPDPDHWTHAVGGNGFGNRELQTYTDRPENAVIESGDLVITAREEHLTGPDGIPRDYTSARLHTREHFNQRYGRFEARIKVPQGQGMWPAFWMLGANRHRDGWPQCGEIDVMENVGKEPGTVHGTVHGPGYSGARGLSAAFELPDNEAFSEGYHIFGVEWSPKKVTFDVDGQPYQTVTPKDLPQGAKWVFDHPFYLLVNLAVGGDWPGPPDETTQFPQEMRVDWVRAYKRAP